MTDPNTTNPPRVVKLCDNCMGEFVQTKPNRRFCCTACQKQEFNRRKLLWAAPQACDCCKKLFAPKRLAQRFCSEPCRVRHHQKRQGPRREAKRFRASMQHHPLAARYDKDGNCVWTREEGVIDPPRPTNIVLPTK